VRATFEISVVEKGKKSPKWRITNPSADRVQTLEELLSDIKFALQDISIQALQEEQAKGFTKKPVITVDGKVGKNIADVNPIGKIVFSDALKDPVFLLNIFKEIVLRSPIGSTGTYRNANVVTLNGDFLADTYTGLQTALKGVELKENDTIRYINIAPYARRLEALGVTAKGANKVMRKTRDKQRRSGPMVAKENGVYFMAAQAIKRFAKTSSLVKFEIMPGHTLGINSIPVVAGGRLLRKTYKGHEPGEKKGRNFRKGTIGSYLYPTIVIRIREGTFTS